MSQNRSITTGNKEQSGVSEEPPLPTTEPLQASSEEADKWGDWRWQLQNSFNSLEELGQEIELLPEEQNGVGLPVRVTPYYFSVIKKNPILRRTMIPTLYEKTITPDESDDPLKEHNYSQLPNLVHKYPSKVLFLTTDLCSAYCRFCTRSRIVGHNVPNGRIQWESALQYIESTPTIKDVLLSGGDPLMLSDENIEYLLSRVQSIPHVMIKRIGTKMPVVLPQRITPNLVDILKKYQPIYMSLHFTHPSELTKETREACIRLADAGIVLRSQTVLLRGINDNVETLKTLFEELLTIRVVPLYLYRMDCINGGSHFRTSIQKGIEMIEGLRGYITGYAVPQYIVDSEGGKIAVNPDTLQKTKDGYLLKNFKGKTYFFKDQPL